MARPCPHTYRTPAAPAKALSARQRLAQRCAESEPMHHWPHPIPATDAPCPPPEAQAPSDAAMTQVLEHLTCQSQLMVDLLGAVNGLTAAVLAKCSR